MQTQIQAYILIYSFIQAFIVTHIQKEMIKEKALIPGPERLTTVVCKQEPFVCTSIKIVKHLLNFTGSQ